MKLTIITVVLNGADTIRDTIESVLSQTYKNIEYIIIDGNSSDGTMDIVNIYKKNIDIILSEEDQGLYAAINKGIGLATGDVIGLLHSDDFYTDNTILQTVVQEFDKSKADTVFADLVYIKGDNYDKVIRYFSAKNFEPKKLTYGLMPPHPTFFVKKSIYDTHGLYKTDYQIAADYEMFIRLLYKQNVSYSYIHKAIVKMRVGGVSGGSGIMHKVLNNLEVIRAMKNNGINTNHFLILRKYPVKILEIIKGYVYNFYSKK